MNKKVRGKLSLSKETLRTMEALSLKEAVGGFEPTDQTNPCSLCPACNTFFDTCLIETGFCHETCQPTGCV